jgi:hypothetical protein
MTKSSYTTFVLATTILGFAAALGGCGSGTDKAAAPQTPTASVPASSESPAAVPATTEPTSGAPTGQPADVTTDDGGCPVSEATLLKIINTTEDFATTVALHNRECYNGWASGNQEISTDWTASHGRAQPMAFLFRYDRKAGRWAYVSAGTSDICPGSVPADVRKHLRVCGY